jgi:hypothetical protein
MQVGQWSGDGFGLLPAHGALHVNIPGLTHNAPQFTSQKCIEPLTPLTQIGGTCYAFATVNYIRYTCRNLPQRSGLALAWLAQKILGMGDESASRAVFGGGYVRAAVGAALAWGLPAEEDHRDLDENVQLVNNILLAKKPTVQAVMGAFYDARLCYDSMHQLRVSEAQDLAEQGIPSLICLPVTEEIYKASTDGTTLTGEGRIIGGHVYTLLGRNILQSTWGACGREGMGLFEATDHHLSQGFDLWTGVPIWAKQS